MTIIQFLIESLVAFVQFIAGIFSLIATIHDLIASLFRGSAKSKSIRRMTKGDPT